MCYYVSLEHSHWQDPVLCGSEGLTSSLAIDQSSLLHGPFHREAHNMAACFFKTGKQKEKEIKTGQSKGERARAKARIR